jgi:hypothetical protein
LHATTPRNAVPRATTTNGTELVAKLMAGPSECGVSATSPTSALPTSVWVSEAKKSIVPRAAALTIELERLESAFAVADGADEEALDLYQRASNSLRRPLESIGLQGQQRPDRVAAPPQRIVRTFVIERHAHAGSSAMNPRPTKSLSPR